MIIIHWRVVGADTVTQCWTFVTWISGILSWFLDDCFFSESTRNTLKKPTTYRTKICHDVLDTCINIQQCRKVQWDVHQTCVVGWDSRDLAALRKLQWDQTAINPTKSRMGWAEKLSTINNIVGADWEGSNRLWNWDGSQHVENVMASLISERYLVALFVATI